MLPRSFAVRVESTECHSTSDKRDRYMRLALKAQAQCRATLETLATVKNPPVNGKPLIVSGGDSSPAA